MLPDVALLNVFDFYVNTASTWHRLVHVCHNWRNIVFGSPRRLNLRLYCKPPTPARKTLDVWPPLPIVIWFRGLGKWGLDNIIAALECNTRVCTIDGSFVQSSLSEEFLAAMQQPFPALTRLSFMFGDEGALVVPVSFLGGSAPSLETLILHRIPFPGLPKLLMSTTHLVGLALLRVPHSGYISPEAMVTVLAALTRLEYVFIGFESPRCRPDQTRRRPPPLTRIPLTVLTELGFKGVSEYSEDFMARIDTPRLNKLDITFFHRLSFDTPQLTQFISRTPKLRTHDEARVVFSEREASVALPQTFGGMLKLAISCRQPEWQLSSLAQFCSSSFPQAHVPAVEHLHILEDRRSQLRWQDDVENSQWLELLHPFTAVKSLYISREFAPRISPTLQELVGERVTEVLPVLQTLSLEEALPLGPVQEIIGQFVAARHLANHPIAVSRWEGGKK
jgi:hypothetical protein